MQNVSNPNISIPLNVGWAPKQTIPVTHASNSKDLKLFYPQRWDVVNEGANPHGIWYQGKLGVPRTDITNPGKGAKAAKARALFASRLEQIKGNLTLNKPIQTVGEVPDRSWLSYYADNAGADGLIYNNVYDNGYNNQVILGFRKLVQNTSKPAITTKNYTYFDKTNFNDNSAIYHFQRLLDGGFQQVKSRGDVTTDFPVRIYQIPKQKKEAYDEILNRAGDKVSTSEINQVLDDIFYGGTSVDLDGKPLGVILTDSPNVYSNIVSHELDHAIHTPSQYPVGFSKNASAYFLQNNGSELAARGSQIKDYFKITNPNQPITEDMLKYASQNYIKDTGINNNMTEFFSNIVDWKQAAKWLSKYATGVSIPTLGTTFPSLEKYNEQK